MEIPSAAAILISARTEALQSDGRPVVLHLLPPSDAIAASDFSKRYPRGIGPDFAEVTGLCAGFGIDSLEVSFTDYRFQGFDGLLNDWLELYQDGYGNTVAMEIMPSGLAGPVWFVSHDPPVMVLVAHGLAEFVDLVIDAYRATKKHRENAFVSLHDLAMKVWQEPPRNRGASECIDSPDRELREFARTLSPTSVILDTRGFKPGDGIVCDEISQMRPVLLCPSSPMLRATEA